MEQYRALREIIYVQLTRAHCVQCTLAIIVIKCCNGCSVCCRYKVCTLYCDFGWLYVGDVGHRRQRWRQRHLHFLRQQEIRVHCWQRSVYLMTGRWVLCSDIGHRPAPIFLTKSYTRARKRTVHCLMSLYINKYIIYSSIGCRCSFADVMSIMNNFSSVITTSPCSPEFIWK